MTAENNASPKAPESAVDIWRVMPVFSQAFRDFWRCLPDLLFYDLLFKAVAFVVLTPTTVWLFRRFVASSGNAAVGNFDIVRLTLTPVGLVVTLLLLALLLAITFGQMAGLIYIGLGAAAGRRVTYVDALRQVATKAGRLFRASLLVLMLVAVVVVPFVLAILATAMSFITDHDINYYLDSQPPEFRLAVAISVGIAVVGVIMLGLACAPVLFLLPETLLGKGTVRQALRRSRRLIKGHYLRAAAAILLWIAIWGGVSSVLNAAIYLVGWSAVSAAHDVIHLLIFALGFGVAVSVIVNLAISFAAVATGCLVIAKLYRQAHGDEEIDVAAFDALGTPLGQAPQWSIPQKTPLFVAIATVLLAAGTAYSLLQTAEWKDHVENSAHRGASLAAPENTLSAVRQAIADGATFVEIDVQRTADGVIVVCHDADLMRVGGSPLVIARSTFDQLRKVDVGRRFGAPFAGERVPTLDEVIDAVRGRVKLIVELKSYGEKPQQLAEDVVKILQDREMLSDAVIMSLEYGELGHVQRLDPKIEVGFVATAALGDISKLDVDFLAIAHAKATDALVATAHAQGKDVYVWTVDDPNVMFIMIDRGVDNIITNDPATLAAVLHNRLELSAAERILLRFRSIYER